MRRGNRRILILHHLQPYWEDGYRRSGTSFRREMGKAIRHIRRGDYDRVIVTLFERDQLDPEHWPIAPFIGAVYEYGFGWEQEDHEDFPEDFCKGGDHSGSVWIAPWMREIHPADDVVIGGAFDGECLEDLEIALEHLGIAYTRAPEIIV